MWGDSESASKIRRIPSSKYEKNDFQFSHWLELACSSWLARSPATTGVWFSTGGAKRAARQHCSNVWTSGNDLVGAVIDGRRTSTIHWILGRAKKANSSATFRAGRPLWRAHVRYCHARSWSCSSVDQIISLEYTVAQLSTVLLCGRIIRHDSSCQSLSPTLDSIDNGGGRRSHFPFLDRLQEYKLLELDWIVIRSSIYKTTSSDISKI